MSVGVIVGMGVSVGVNMGVGVVVWGLAGGICVNQSWL